MRWGTTLSGLRWSGEITNYEAKSAVAERLSHRLENGDVVGVGSGSTSFLAVQALQRRARREGLGFTAIPTSIETAMACSSLDVPTSSLRERRPDWSFDGADEVDGQQRLIKGRGGALFREKLIMAASPERYIVVDRSKLVAELGSKYPVPVEIDPSAVNLVVELIRGDQAIQEITLRLAKGKDGPVITERGNILLDLRCRSVDTGLHARLKALPGVIETGIFQEYDLKLVVSD